MEKFPRQRSEAYVVRTYNSGHPNSTLYISGRLLAKREVGGLQLFTLQFWGFLIDYTFSLQSEVTLWVLLWWFKSRGLYILVTHLGFLYEDATWYPEFYFL